MVLASALNIIALTAVTERGLFVAINVGTHAMARRNAHKKNRVDFKLLFFAHARPGQKKLTVGNLFQHSKEMSLTWNVTLAVQFWKETEKWPKLLI